MQQEQAIPTMAPELNLPQADSEKILTLDALVGKATWVIFLSHAA